MYQSGGGINTLGTSTTSANAEEAMVLSSSTTTSLHNSESTTVAELRQRLARIKSSIASGVNNPM
jgi:hypothetical protein